MTDTESKLVISRIRDQARLTRSFDLRLVGTSGVAPHPDFIPVVIPL